MDERYVLVNGNVRRPHMRVIRGKGTTKKAKKASTVKGERMIKGHGWQLVRKDRKFVGTLVTTINDGSTRLAIFRVPK